MGRNVFAANGLGKCHRLGTPGECRPSRRSRAYALAIWTAISLLGSGCSSIGQWWHNGFKVGPNYEPPAVSVSSGWIDSPDPRVKSDPADLCAWWTLFNDPVLNSLIETAYRQNLDVRRAGIRILEARANCHMTAGNLMPQSQSLVGAYANGEISKTLTQGALTNTFGIWVDGGYASWELDFWGRFRRQLESAKADQGAAIENYNDIVVLLLSDVASSYVQLRTYQQRLEYARRNVELQQGSLELASSRFKSGMADETDVIQAEANREETAATISQLEAGLRQANNRLCILLGEPVRDLVGSLEARPIPTAPVEVALGVPADLLRRRPDVHRAEREVASQCAQIGFAESDLYPHFSLLGFLGDTSNQFGTLFNAASFTGFIVPSFQWKILNYGRIRNNVVIQDAKFQQKVLEYEQVTLKAGQEVEDAVVAFLRTQEQAQHLSASAQKFEQLVSLVVKQYQGGTTDFNRVFTTQLSLVSQQDRLAVARQDIALNLIKIYRALGGGWDALQCPEACQPESAPTLVKNVIIGPDLPPWAPAGSQTGTAAASPATLPIEQNAPTGQDAPGKASVATPQVETRAVERVR